MNKKIFIGESNMNEETNVEHDIEEMRHFLNHYTCRVIFIKSNGEERDIVGTRNPQIIEETTGEKHTDDSHETKGDPDGVVTFFSLEESSWKRFKLENLISLTPNVNIGDVMAERIFDNKTILSNKTVDDINDILKDYLNNGTQPDVERVRTIVEELDSLETINLNE